MNKVPSHTNLTKDHHVFCVISSSCVYDPEMAILGWGMKYVCWEFGIALRITSELIWENYFERREGRMPGKKKREREIGERRWGLNIFKGGHEKMKKV